MNAVFNDMQDHSSPLDGATVHDQKGLFALMESVQNREPFGCELIGENGYKLTIGIGKEVGFVQHSPADGETPYLLAVTIEKVCDEEYCGFLVGNTPTPIPQRFCLPFETVKQIAAYFIRTGERSPMVSWEEI